MPPLPPYVHTVISKWKTDEITDVYIQRVVDHLPLMTYGLKLSLEA